MIVTLNFLNNILSDKIPPPIIYSVPIDNGNSAV